MSVRVPRETIEKFEVVVSSTIDPTSSAVEFAFVADGRPSSWVAGTWDGSYASGRATAVTPTIGTTDSGATVELEPGTYAAFVRISVTPEVPVRQCGAVTLV